MVTYYISYGEPPRRFPRWLLFLSIPASVLAMSAAAAALWLLPAASDDADANAAAPPPVRFNAAIAAVYQPETTTIFLVDASGSIADSGNLESLRNALASLALDDISRLGAVADSSLVGLTTFDTAPKSVIPPEPLDGDAARQRWLLQAGHLQTGTTGGSFIYDAVRATHRRLLDTDHAGQAPVIVLLSDGIDGAVGQCRPAPPGTITEYCVGPGGDPLPCADLPATGGGGVTQICNAIYSETKPAVLLDELAASAVERNLTVHAIGYGRRGDHGWLRRAAEATGGRYIHAGQ